MNFLRITVKSFTARTEGRRERKRRNEQKINFEEKKRKQHAFSFQILLLISNMG